MAGHSFSKEDRPIPINMLPFSQKTHSNTLAKISKLSKHSFSLNSNFGIGRFFGQSLPIHRGRVRLLALTKCVNCFVGAILSKIKKEKICIHNNCTSYFTKLHSYHIHLQTSYKTQTTILLIS